MKKYRITYLISKKEPNLELTKTDQNRNLFETFLV